MRKGLRFPEWNRESRMKEMGQERGRDDGREADCDPGNGFKESI